MSEINDAATVAFSEYITSCTVIVTSDEHGFDHGSGVAVRYKGKEYIRNVAVNIRQSIVAYGHADTHTTDAGL